MPTPLTHSLIKKLHFSSVVLKYFVWFICAAPNENQSLQVMKRWWESTEVARAVNLD